jgi:hypothetical protein
VEERLRLVDVEPEVAKAVGRRAVIVRHCSQKTKREREELVELAVGETAGVFYSGEVGGWVAALTPARAPLTGLVGCSACCRLPERLRRAAPLLGADGEEEEAACGCQAGQL